MKKRPKYKISQVAVNPFTGQKVPLQPLPDTQLADAIEAIKEAHKRPFKLKPVSEEPTIQELRQDGQTSKQAEQTIIMIRVKEVIKESGKARECRAAREGPQHPVELYKEILSIPSDSKWTCRKVLQYLNRVADASTDYYGKLNEYKAQADKLPLSYGRANKDDLNNSVRQEVYEKYRSKNIRIDHIGVITNFTIGQHPEDDYFTWQYKDKSGGFKRSGLKDALSRLRKK